MTNYAGESYEIVDAPKGFNGVALTGADVTETVEVFDADGAVVVPETDMTWDAGQQLWVYQWNTTALEPGTYRAKLVVTGPGSTTSMEFQRIRLARRPVGG